MNAACRTRFSLAVLGVASLFLGAAGGGGGTAWGQPRSSLNLELVGPSSNDGKVQRCREVFERSGYAIDPRAALRLRLTLAPFVNRLEIFSARRGLVYNQTKPGWGMNELCQDALAVAQQQLLQENASPAPLTATMPAPFTAAPSPARSSITFDVLGPMANPRKQAECIAIAERNGLSVVAGAPIRVTLTLQPGFNQLQITSARRGLVLNQNRPPWGMGTLCQDAVSQVQRAIIDDGQPPIASTYAASPPPASQPAPGMLVLGPIPPGPTITGPTRHAVDRAINAWKAGQFEAALNAFREAARMTSDATLLFDRAVCEQKLGRYGEAQSHVQLFLDMAPQSPYRPYADQLAAELQHQAAPPPIAPPPPSPTVIAPTIQINPGYHGAGVFVPAQNYCKWGTDCGPGEFCRDRGDGVHLCMGNGVRNAACAWGTDCGPGLFCRDPGDGFKVCMP